MPDGHPNPELIALGVRQPWAELILRGTKTIEVRSQSTNVRGTIYLYASKKYSAHAAASAAVGEYNLDMAELPLGMLVGTVEIVDAVPCEPGDAQAACVSRNDVHGQVGWHLRNPVRFREPLEVRYLPYGVWFYPFRRRTKSK